MILYDRLLMTSAKTSPASKTPPAACPLVLALACLLALYGCSHGNGKGSTAASGLEQGTVELLPPGRTVRVQVEVVRSDEDRQRGLMYRKTLPESRGMLFLFDRQQVQSFWMKNTYIPLDMIFIDESMKVVGIVRRAEPLTTTSRKVDNPSRYVLEVAGGFADRNGITRGTAVRFHLGD